VLLLNSLVATFALRDWKNKLEECVWRVLLNEIFGLFYWYRDFKE